MFFISRLVAGLSRALSSICDRISTIKAGLFLIYGYRHVALAAKPTPAKQGSLTATLLLDMRPFNPPLALAIGADNALSPLAKRDGLFKPVGQATADAAPQPLKFWSNTMPSIDLKTISELVQRHQGSGSPGTRRLPPSLPRGTYTGRVLTAEQRENKWGLLNTKALLEVTEGLHTGRQISFHFHGQRSALVTEAATSCKPIVFDIYLAIGSDGLKNAKVNSETVRWADETRPDLNPGLPKHVRAMLHAADFPPAGGGPDRNVADRTATTPQPTIAAPQTAHDVVVAAAEFKHGFACIGSKEARRKIVDWTGFHSAMATCTATLDTSGPVFLSMYAFADDFVDFVTNNKKPGSTAGYDGRAYSPLIVFDIDRKDNTGKPVPEVALKDSLSLLVKLLELGISPECIVISYSGSKGFHIEFPSMLAAAMPSVRFPESSNRFCSMVAAEAGVDIDRSLYRKVQPLRSPNSPHEGTGLYKISMGPEEFRDLSLAEIQALAAQPRVFVLPSFVHEPLPLLSDLWRHAEVIRGTTGQSSDQTGRDTDREPHISQSTWDFLINGAPDGERANATFKAAANLSDFDDTGDLIRSLLGRGTKLCGLPPAEATAHIDSALRRAAEGRLRKQIGLPT